MRSRWLLLVAVLLVAPMSSASESPVFTRYPTGDCAATNLTIADDGAVWFDCSSLARIGRLSHGVVSFTTMPVPPYLSNHVFAPGDGGDMWYAGADGVYRITKTFQVTKMATLTSPQSIARGTDGNFWVTETDGPQIARVTSSGSVTQFDLAPHAGPIDIVVGPDGALWFRTQFEIFDSTKPPGVGRITTQGSVSYFPINAPHGFSTPLLPGPNQKLYAPAGAWPGIAIAMDGSWTQTVFVRDAAVGPDGQFWVANSEGLGRLDYAVWYSQIAANRTGLISSGTGFWFFESPMPPIPPPPGIFSANSTDPVVNSVVQVEFTAAQIPTTTTTVLVLLFLTLLGLGVLRAAQ